MAATEQLPRKIQLDQDGGMWPARTIVKIYLHQLCQHCGLEIAYFADNYLTGQWAHTDTEKSRCATEKFELAAPIPRCPQCTSLNIQYTQTSWGNATDCPDCKYHAYFSIGD